MFGGTDLSVLHWPLGPGGRGAAEVNAAGALWASQPAGCGRMAASLVPLFPFGAYVQPFGGLPTTCTHMSTEQAHFFSCLLDVPGIPGRVHRKQRYF